MEEGNTILIAEDQVPPQRRSRRRRQRPLVWLCVLFIVLLVLAAILFGILVGIQRDIAFELASYNLNKDAAKYGPEGFTVPLSVVFTTTNRNFYDISLNTVIIQGTHPLYDGTIASGDMNSTVLYKRTEDELASGIVIMSYSFASDPEGAYLADVVKNCSDSTSGGGKLYLDFKAKAEYSMFLMSGEETYYKDVTIDCPQPDELF